MSPGLYYVTTFFLTILFFNIKMKRSLVSGERNAVLIRSGPATVTGDESGIGHCFLFDLFNRLYCFIV